MANTNTFREIGICFGISKASAWRIVERTSVWLISIGHEFIKWPNTSEAFANMAKVEATKKFPFVIGCIDSTHIKINAPHHSEEAYFNRKHYYSLILQAVCDANGLFIDVCVGEPGSLHDCRVLRRSQLYSTASLPSKFLNGSFILGDSAYPNLNWLVSPFKDNGSLSSAQRQFNVMHSQARIVIEDAFGRMKTRFRRLLHFMEQQRTPAITNLIMCACILHNICCSQNDEIDNEFTQNVYSSEDIFL
ncbi:putative nuclease HARBI1 [Teleopsis dalmanni]|uniref:putative nuclease HARBI1 n=1 Tax=Teleopsis dalmanni TaxID=139649 RepID=UPI0018CCA3A6|nr:putative nuclease HARBI1 [Teleopsis dalmanni]